MDPAGRTTLGLGSTTTAFALAGLAFLLALVSPVRYEDSDPALLLLSAQAIVDHGSPDLTVYRDHPRFGIDLENDRRVVPVGRGRVHRSVGSPWLLVPIVAVTRAVGLDMLDEATERRTQNVVSASVCALVLLLLFHVVRAWLAPGEALILASVFVFGSSLLSTLGTALWTPCLLLPPALLALAHLARAEAGLARRSAPLRTSALLGLAILARPTAGFLAVGLGVGELIRRKVSLRVLVVTLAATLLVVAALFLPPLRDLVPVYYSPRRLVPRTPLATGLLGTWLSPSRGLLVFSPFLLPILVGVVLGFRSLARRPLFWSMAAWIALHSFALAGKSFWWGGHSYGPRLSLELMPGFAVLAALCRVDLPVERRRPLVAAFLLLALPAVVLHSGIGLFQPAVRTWNEVPNVDRHPELLFRWDHPQFLADEESIVRRHRELQRERLEHHVLGRPLGPDSADALFDHWYATEGGWRWTWGTRSDIVIRLDEIDESLEWALCLDAFPLGRQSVEIGVNDAIPTAFELRPRDEGPVLLEIPAGALRRGENRIRFHVPGARSPGGKDARILGLALRRLTILPRGRSASCGSHGTGLQSEPPARPSETDA